MKKGEQVLAAKKVVKSVYADAHQTFIPASSHNLEDRTSYYYVMARDPVVRAPQDVTDVNPERKENTLGQGETILEAWLDAAKHVQWLLSHGLVQRRSA